MDHQSGLQERARLGQAARQNARRSALRPENATLTRKSGRQRQMQRRQSLYSLFNISVLCNNNWRLSAEFKSARHQPLCRNSRNTPPGFRSSGQIDPAHMRGSADRLSGLCALLQHDCSRRQASLAAPLCQDERRNRRKFRGLYQTNITRRQRSRQFLDEIRTGWFHGVRRAHTPQGSYAV